MSDSTTPSPAPRLEAEPPPTPAASGRFGAGLRARMLLAQLLVVAVGMGTLLFVVRLVAVDAFESAMGHGTGGMGGTGGMDQMMASAVRGAFNDALATALLLAGAAALIAAISASALLSNWLATPIKRMAAASRRIAEGRYGERVAVAQGGEIAELAGSFNAMAASLEATERRRLELVGDVAHELRTPLTTLDGYLEGLEDGVIQPSADTWALLRQQTARLSHLVGDLQELWRAEAREIPFRTEQLEAGAVWSGVVERLAQAAAARAIELRVEVPHDQIVALGDRERLAQVLDNIVGNAVRYSPEGGMIALRASGSPSRVVFSVHDQGPGLTAEQRRRVFERFYRVDPSRSRALGGSGIGLAIARALTEGMGGRIWADSAGPGQGSTFSVALPAAT